MDFVVPAPAVPAVPVEGGGEFPVRRIFCVGRNYAEHTREMGHDPDREDPFFFTKPADAIVLDGATIPYPSMTASLHHEIELVAAIGKGGHDIPEAEALHHLFGYAVGVDLTRRDLQNEAKKLGRPWDMAKGFDHSAPIGPLTRADATWPLDRGAIWLRINGETRQSSDVSKLIWSTPEVIAYLSRYVALAPGDLIYTGTPEGVGRIEPGDDLWGHIDGLHDLRIHLAGR
ncbi:MAG: fumarylacetoacetate hydrolase family protein [Caulobacteraceae bacterium]